MKSKWDVSWTPFEHSLDEAFGLIGTRVSSHRCELKRVGFSAERYRPCSISIAFRLCLCSGSDLDPVRNLDVFFFFFVLFSPLDLFLSTVTPVMPPSLHYRKHPWEGKYIGLGRLEATFI